MTSDHASDLLQRVNRLRIYCSAMIDQQLAGSSGSTFQGQGIEFEETRPYQPGDDVRAIDWRVTARFGHPFVKLFREERQSRVFLIVDRSGSMAAPPIGPTPWDRLAEVAGVLALLATAENNRVGMMLFSDHVDHTVPPAGGTEWAMRILRDLVAWKPDKAKQTNLRIPLERLCRTERRRCVAIILSDFLCEGYERALRVATSMHDVIPIVFQHPLQRMLPKCGMLPVRDPESGQMIWIDTFSRRQREQYQTAADAVERQRDGYFAKLRVPVLHLSTDDDIAVKLHRFFDRRREVQ